MGQGGSRKVMPPRSIPADVEGGEKARGLVRLPQTVQWSGPQRVYDLDDRADRVRVYEQVLRVGTEDDLRRFIVVDELIELWDELYLPAHVREVWRNRLAWHRGVELAC